MKLFVKPCPFCGGPARVRRHKPCLPELPAPWWTVRCKNEKRCLVLIHLDGPTQAAAVEKWNRRLGDDFAYPTITELEKIVNRPVNESFRHGFTMARTTNLQLKMLVER